MSKFTSDNQPKKRRGRGKSERTKILDAMKAEGKTEEDFYRYLVQRAFNPEDNFGAPELIKRIAPVAKATLPVVEFEFDEKADSHTRANQILKAASDGLIAPDVANMFISSIASTLRIEEVTSLKERLEQIEKLMGVDNG